MSVWNRTQSESNLLEKEKETKMGVEPVSLNEVMSQQLADQLQAEDNDQEAANMIEAQLKSLGLDVDEMESSDHFCTNRVDKEETRNDQLLAQILQIEFDKESDASLGRQERKVNGSSKVSLSFENYRRLPHGLADSESESDEEDDTSRHWDSFETAEKINSGVTIGKSGVAKMGDGMVTKHDPSVCGRRNACKVMNFDISTGDGGSFDMSLSNNVYNALKKHSVAEGKRAARLHEKKEKSTVDHVMDEKTRLMMFKLINHGILDEVNGTINIGKEANVYHGIGGDPEKKITVGEVAIKVYKTTLSEFKNRDPYIKDDYRFKDRFSKQNPRKVIHLWAEKEMFNLIRIRRAGIRCPEVVALKKHILVMTFLGKDAKHSPILKDASLNNEERLNTAYKETIDIMKNLFSKCELIHADLSEYNLMWHENHVWVIDVSQSVFKDHPNALKFLLRDCYNISNFFRKKGVKNTMTCQEIFTEVCGKSLPGGNLDGIELLSKMEDYEKDQELLAHGLNTKSECFDQMFQKSQQERVQGLESDMHSKVKNEA